MEAEEPLDNEYINGVVEHMNADHSVACLTIVQAFTEHKHAKSALMISMDRFGIDFQVGDETVRIMFIKKLRNENQIRGHLVAMSKQARAELSTVTSPPQEKY